MTMSTLIPGAHSVIANQYKDLTTNNPIIDSLHEPRRMVLAPCDYSGDGKPKKCSEYIPTVQIPGIEYSGMIEDVRFVIRVPEKWNGKLVAFATPGFGDERSGDSMVSDYLLTQVDDQGNSYAFFAIDKGAVGEVIPMPDGRVEPLKKSNTAMLHENDNFAKWTTGLKNVTVAAKLLLKKTRGYAPNKTYLIGMSNGGYTARYAMENFDELYDGMLDWEGVLWRAREGGLLYQFTEGIKAWRCMEKGEKGSAEYKKAAQVFADMGYPATANHLLPYFVSVFFCAHLDIYRMKLDPEFLHREWWEYGMHPEDYYNYSYSDRPAIVRERIEEFENTGKIKKPVITVFGNCDGLLLYGLHGKAYETLVLENGNPDQYRLYTIDKGTHLDSLAGHPTWDKDNQLQPLLPYVHQAFNLLVDWVEKGIAPPASKFIPKPTNPHHAVDIVSGKKIMSY